MSKERAPAFQFYPRDFLSDEHVRVMGPCARGAYITLLCVTWIEGSIPSEDFLLGKLADTPQKTWNRIRGDVLACFDLRDNGRYYHKRLDLERERQAKYSATQAEKGKRSAQHRFNRGSTVVQPDCNSSSSSSSSSAEKTQSDLPAGKPLAYRPRIGVAWPGRPPVPAGLHAEFVEKLGGEDPDARLRAWYPTAAAVYADRPIGDDDFTFWRARFREWLGTTVKPVQPAEEPIDMDALQREVSERLAKRKAGRR